MSTKVGDIFVSANLDRSQYNKGLGMMQKEAQKVGSAIGKKLGLGLGIVGLGAFIKKATDAGASLNAMGTIIDASLPHMTKQVDDFAKSAGQAFGLSETQAKGFVGKFASMASAMGYTEKQAYNMSTALTGLAGDVASYYHISQDDAYAKLGAVFTGETEALKQLGVVMTQNALDQFALQQGFGATTAQMTEMEKTTLRYMFVMDRLKLTVGDFSKYAYTWSGSIATIKLNWANFMATVGQGIINILLPLLQVIAKISSALTALGSMFLGWTKRVMGIKAPLNNAFGKKTQTDLKNVGGGIGNVGSGLGGVGKNAKGAKKQVQALKKELLGFDKITKLSGEQGVSTGGAGTGGGGGIGGGGIDFGEAESDLASFSELAKNYLENIKLPPALSLALKDLKDAFSNLFGVLKDAGKWALDNVLIPLGKWTLNELAPEAVKLLANVINLLANALKLVGTILEPLWKPLIKPVFEFLGGVAVDAIKAVNTVVGTLAKVLGTASDGFKNIKTWAENAVNTAKTKWKDLKDKVTDLPVIQKVIDAFKSLKSWGETATDKIKTKWEELKKKVTDIIPKVSINDKITGVVDKIKKAWEKIRSVFYKKNGKKKNISASVKIDLINNFTKKWNKVKKIWNSIKSKTATITISFKNLLTSAWNAVARAVNGAKAKAPAVIAKILPTMPYLAEGGYAKRNTPRLAVIGDNKREGEIVAPESKLRAMAQEVANNSSNAEMVRLLNAILIAVQTKDNSVYLDGKEIKNSVVKHINNHTRATGQLELII